MEKGIKKGDTSMFWIILIIVLLLIGLPFLFVYKSDTKNNNVTEPITVNGGTLSDYDDPNSVGTVDNIDPNESVSDVFNGLWSQD